MTREKMINMANKEMLTDILSETIGKSCKVDRLITDWSVTKKSFFQLFGEKLTIEKSIEFFVDEAVIKDDWYNFYTNRNLISVFCGSLDNYLKYMGRDVIPKGETEEKFNLKVSYFRYIRNLKEEELKNNKIKNEDKLLVRNKKVSLKGWKVTKAIKTLLSITGADQSVINNIITDFSKLIQSWKTKGTFVLSIDPIDYVLMSESGGDWSSCHGFGGCHQGGTLSYMTDDNTIICYLHKDETFDIYGHKYIKKIWRQVIYLDAEEPACIFSKGYPFRSAANSQVITNMVKSLFPQVEKWKNIEDDEFSEWVTVENHYFIDKDGEEAEGTIPYIDIFYSSEAAGMLPENSEEYSSYMEIGDSPICPVCNIDYVVNGELLTCDECAGRTKTTHCCKCNNELQEKYIFFYDEGGNPYCEKCFNEHFTCCPCCKETINKCNTYDADESNIELCRNCYRGIISNYNEEEIA